MKTTVELPEELLRRAKALAATEGVSMKQLFTEALNRRLAETAATAEPAWKNLAGKLHDLRGETRRIQRTIDDEFERLDEGEAGD